MTRSILFTSLHNLQVLAESTQRLSDEFKSRHPEIEWYKIAGLRNILVHDYLGIDLETVWAAVTSKLPELKAVVRAIIPHEKGATLFRCCRPYL